MAAAAADRGRLRRPDGPHLRGGPHCGTRCSYKLLANPRDNHWLARIVDRSRAECVDIDLDRFGINESHGIAGIVMVNCDAVPAAGA